MGDFKLKDVYPTLFRIASHKNATVADLWKREGDKGGCWEVQFRRPFQDWKVEEVTHFLVFLYLLKVQEGEDTLCWKEDRKGIFSVKSCYCSLRMENSVVFPGKVIWGSCAHLRTCFFAWEVVWGKILIVDTLMKRGWQMVNRSNLCKDSEQSADHILIHCAKTRELWTFLLALFGFVWEVSFYNGKLRGFKRKKKRAVWRLAPICLFWCIWKKRNQRTFKDEKLSDQRLKDLFIQTLFEQSRDSLELELLSILNFLDTLYCG